MKKHSTDQYSKKEPKANIVSKEVFQQRTNKVFYTLLETLGKSFGPYGAPTIISCYPYFHITKDGFTIMKNIRWNTKDSKIDQVISDMMSTICGRLNYAVGDGTTTAVIATGSIYNQYMKEKKWFDSRNIIPRNILKQLNILAEEIINKLNDMVITIDMNDMETALKAVRDIVYVSSNGDEEITNIIVDIYRELKYPMITVSAAKDGKTKKTIIDGYQLNVGYSDQMYVNEDDGCFHGDNCDVLIFDHKITERTYLNIIKPLNNACAQRGRKLIIIAPYYDEVAIQGIMKRDINAEFNNNHSVNLVLTTCATSRGIDKVMLEDLAMLLNTTTINRTVEANIIQELEENKSKLISIFNLDSRNIVGNTIVSRTPTGFNFSIDTGNTTEPEKDNYIMPMMEPKENAIRVGFIKTAIIGKKQSTFRGFYYDETIYNNYITDAKKDLEETINMYKELGTFNLAVSEKQLRLSSLSLKLASIEVGASSELSQSMTVDAVDDAVKAIKSAMNNGYVLGCNVSLLKAIDSVLDSYLSNDQNQNDQHTLSIKLLSILRNGFEDVYKKVIINGYPDIENEKVEMVNVDLKDSYLITDILKSNISYYIEKINKYFQENIDNNNNTDINNTKDSISMIDTIIMSSIITGSVFDVTTKKFSHNIINSVDTDKEVLKATADLLGLLITGNQLVLTDY